MTADLNGLFAQQVALELDKIFPEYPLKDIPHNHEIYKLYYQLPRPPRGGDVFWSAPGAGQGAQGTYTAISSRFAYQKGISIGRRLAVVYNRKDYMCAMETAEVDSRALLRDRRSTDVHRFMTTCPVGLRHEIRRQHRQIAIPIAQSVTSPPLEILSTDRTSSRRGAVPAPVLFRWEYITRWRPRSAPNL